MGKKNKNFFGLGSGNGKTVRMWKWRTQEPTVLAWIKLVEAAKGKAQQVKLENIRSEEASELSESDMEVTGDDRASDTSSESGYSMGSMSLALENRLSKIVRKRKRTQAQDENPRKRRRHNPVERVVPPKPISQALIVAGKRQYIETDAEYIKRKRDEQQVDRVLASEKDFESKMKEIGSEDEKRQRRMDDFMKDLEDRSKSDRTANKKEPETEEEKNKKILEENLTWTFDDSNTKEKGKMKFQAGPKFYREFEYELENCDNGFGATNKMGYRITPLTLNSDGGRTLRHIKRFGIRKNNLIDDVFAKLIKDNLVLATKLQKKELDHKMGLGQRRPMHGVGQMDKDYGRPFYIKYNPSLKPSGKKNKSNFWIKN